MNTDSRRDKQQEPDRFDIFTMEEAEQAARAALECDRDEPGDFIRMLVTLLDASRDARMTDALDFLIDGAFSCSISFSAARKRYVKALRKGRNPDEESRAEFRAEPDSPSPLIDFCAELFTTARDVIARGNKDELRGFKLAIEAMLSDLPAPDASPEPSQTSKPDKRRERFMELAEAYGSIEYVWHNLEKILWAAERTDNEEEFEQQVLADALALVIQSPHTPEALRGQLEQSILDIEGETDAQEPLDPDNLREWFPIALRRLKEQQEKVE
jgi:hypothetical protein